jgi:hypothetical protein
MRSAFAQFGSGWSVPFRAALVPFTSVSEFNKAEGGDVWFDTLCGRRTVKLDIVRRDFAKVGEAFFEVEDLRAKASRSTAPGRPPARSSPATRMLRGRCSRGSWQVIATWMWCRHQPASGWSPAIIGW